MLHRHKKEPLCNIEDIVITLERGPDLYASGYKLTIKGTGEVTYEDPGIGGLPDAEVKHKGSVSQDDVLILLNQAVEIGFFALASDYQYGESYTVNAEGKVYLQGGGITTCLPTNTVTVEAGELKHKVIDYEGAPARLGRFENMIDEVASWAGKGEISAEEYRKFLINPKFSDTYISLWSKKMLQTSGTE